MERSKSKQVIERKSPPVNDSQQSKPNLILPASPQASNIWILKSSTKSSIVDHLEQFSSQLFSKAITKEWKEKALQENSGLLQQLTSLQCKENESPETPKKRMKSFFARIKEPTGVSVFDLDSDIRINLVRKLLDLQHLIKTGLDTVLDKHKLVEENNQIIHTLTDLPRRIVEETEMTRPANDQESDSSTDLKERLSGLEAQVTDLKRTIDDLCVKSEANETANRLEIARLKEELERTVGDKLKDEKPMLFEYQIDQIREFFKRENSHKCSENFTCCGISWSLAVQTTVKIDAFGQSQKFLSCILARFDDSDKNNECQTYFELRLLSQLPSRVHKVMTTHYTFSSLNGFGFPTFISESELFDQSAPFVKNDSIKLQIYLRIEKLKPIKSL